MQMQMKRMAAAVFAAAVLSGAGGLAIAQQPSKPAPGPSGMEDRSMDQGMMGGGMMNMMRGCERMMGGHALGGGMMPQLPPGNEKLQLQMHAEMMQKVGEIMAKYAERVREDKPGVR